MFEQQSSTNNFRSFSFAFSAKRLTECRFVHVRIGKMDSGEEGDEFVENNHLAQPGNQFAQTLEGRDLRLKNRRQQQQSEAAMCNEEALMGRYARLNPCQVRRLEMTDRLCVQRAHGLLPVKLKVAPGIKRPRRCQGQITASDSREDGRCPQERSFGA